MAQPNKIHAALQHAAMSEHHPTCPARKYEHYGEGCTCHVEKCRQALPIANDLLDALAGILDAASIDIDDGDLALGALATIRGITHAAIAKATQA